MRFPMKSLSQALENTPSTSIETAPPTNSQNSLQVGSTQGAGMTNIQPRQAPLQESELTKIHSRLLLKTPLLSTVKKKTYGIEGNEPVGEEDALDVQVLLRDNLSQEWIDSALRMSPISATIGHLKRLAMHKRLGSSDSDRSILLHDYSDALKPYSDFTVYLACKIFWERDKSNFFPRVKELSEVCEILRGFFTSLRENIVSLAPPKETPRVKAEESDQGKQDRRSICGHIIDAGGPDYFYDPISNYRLEIVASAKYGWKRPG